MGYRSRTGSKPNRKQRHAKTTTRSGRNLYSKAPTIANPAKPGGFLARQCLGDLQIEDVKGRWEKHEPEVIYHKIWHKQDAHQKAFLWLWEQKAVSSLCSCNKIDDQHRYRARILLPASRTLRVPSAQAGRRENRSAASMRQILSKNFTWRNIRPKGDASA